MPKVDINDNVSDSSLSNAKELLDIFTRISSIEEQSDIAREKHAQKLRDLNDSYVAARKRILDELIIQELKGERKNYAEKLKQIQDVEQRQKDAQNSVAASALRAHAKVEAEIADLKKENFASEKEYIATTNAMKRQKYLELNTLEKRAWLKLEKQKQADIVKDLEDEYAAMDKRTKAAKAFKQQLLDAQDAKNELERQSDAANKQRLTTEEKLLFIAENKKRIAEDQSKLAKEISALEIEAAGASPEDKKKIKKEIADAKKSQRALDRQADANTRAAKRAETETVNSKVARGWSKLRGGVEGTIADTKAYYKAAKDSGSSSVTAGLKAFGQTLTDGLGKMADAMSGLTDKIGAQMGKTYQDQGKLNARLQGSSARYEKLAGNMARVIGMSPAISLSKTTENLTKLIETGTNYNLELRAYIQTATENIASTFNAFDAELLRLIRVQQSDSTAARMGMEASLTKFLNNMFSDSSYLTDVRDTVSGNILDASSLLSKEAATEFEFVVQKWLGALYSLGLSKEATSSIASGLNLLGTGNTSLFDNEALTTLLSMSATKSGQNIGTLLNQGLTANTTNKLLQGMVNYLAEIAGNTDLNNVTRAAYSNVLGISTTDLRTIQNLSAQDIAAIASTNMNYTAMTREAENQVSQIATRMHISQLTSTIYENLFQSAADMIGSNPVTYAMWQVLSMVNQHGGVTIPGIQGMGTGISSEIPITKLIQGGLAGLSLLGSVIGGIGGLFNGGAPALSAFSGMDSISRGTGLDLTNGVQSGFSQSTQYSSRGSGSQSDIEQSTLDESGKKGKDANKTSGVDEESTDLALKFYEEGLIYLETICDLLGVVTHSFGYNLTTNTGSSFSWITTSDNDKKIKTLQSIKELEHSNVSTETSLLVQSVNGTQAMNVNVVGFDSKASTTLSALKSADTFLSGDNGAEALQLLIESALTNINGLKVNVTDVSADISQLSPGGGF